MKILISDYDGTFYNEANKSSIQKNIKEVKKFKDKGNKFGFATGRSFTSIKNEIEKYNIPYDFLICNNGATIFDEQDNILFFYPIDIQVIMKTLRYFDYLGISSSVKLLDIYGQETLKYYEVVEMLCKIKIKNLSDLNKIKEELSFLKSFSFLHVLILSEQVNKADGIEHIKSKYSLDEKDIYTVGDERNDIEMLQKYNGHKMLFSNPVLYNKGIKTTTSVRNLIKSIERK